MSISASTSAPTSPDDKLDFKKIFPIFVVVMIDLLGLTIIIPLLPLYATSFHASPFVIGLLGATYPVMQFIGAPILGRLSDRYGRRPILIISQLGTLLGFLLLGFANSLVLLFVSRIIDGVSGGNISTVQAMISDSTTEKTRTQGLGLIGAAFGLGFIIGPVLAFVALALSGNSYQILGFIAAAFSALSLLLSWFWLRETHDPAQRSTTTARAAFLPSAMFKVLAFPQVGLLFMMMFAQQFSFGGFEQFLPLLTLSRLGLNASGNAALFLYVGVIVVVIQGGLIGMLSRKWGDRKLILIGLTALALGLGLTALTPSQPVPWYSQAEVQRELHMPQGASSMELPDESSAGWFGLGWLLVAMIPAALGGGLLPPSINSLITKRVAPQQRGEMLGTSSAFASGANVLAPLVGGALFQVFSIGAPFWLWTLTLALLLVAALRALRPGREEQALVNPV